MLRDVVLPPPTADTTVVVTGASSGIGGELARELSRRGHHVTLVARRRERLERLAQELRQAEVVQCDLADPAARRKLIEPGGRDLAGLCNSAGFGSSGAVVHLDRTRESEMVQVNVEALHELTAAAVSQMVQRGAGAVLNVASIAGLQPLPGMATYAATKAFVISFSEALHTELAGSGVSCTALCPGPTATEFSPTAGLGELQRALLPAIRALAFGPLRLGDRQVGD